MEPSYRYDPLKNTTPGNRSTEEHIDYIFNHVVEQLSAPQAKIDIVGVSEGAVRTVSFLDAKDNFNKWGKRVQAFAALAMYYDTSDMHNPEFKDWFTKVSIIPSRIARKFRLIPSRSVEEHTLSLLSRAIHFSVARQAHVASRLLVVQLSALESHTTARPCYLSATKPFSIGSRRSRPMRSTRILISRDVRLKKRPSNKTTGRSRLF